VSAGGADVASGQSLGNPAIRAVIRTGGFREIPDKSNIFMGLSDFRRVSLAGLSQADYFENVTLIAYPLGA
jgi:hypothetical protein